MNRLLERVRGLKQSSVKRLVDARLKEFRDKGKERNDEVFKELCFCILTANFNAEKSIRIQNEIGNGFLESSERQLARRLRELGHRYPNTRARYIVEARRYKNHLKEVLRSHDDERALRDWFVENVKGLGYKEASHFLRNIGYKNYAIIDFHIMDLLAGHGLLVRPKAMTKRRYLEIEDLLGKIAAKSSTSLAELDLYLWCMETGKVLK